MWCRIPRLGLGGVAATQKNVRSVLSGAEGAVDQTQKNSLLDFIDRPVCSKVGNSAEYSDSFTPCMTAHDHQSSNIAVNSNSDNTEKTGRSLCSQVPLVFHVSVLPSREIRSPGIAAKGA